MAKPRRLPYPGYGPDPLGPIPKGDAAQDHAEKYLAWYCAKHGIELPDNHYRNTLSYAFHADNDGQCFAYISRRVPESRGYRGKRVLAHSVEEAKISIPAWAMPCKRADLWHAAHQAGADLTVCHEIANPYGRPGDTGNKSVSDAAAAMDAPTFGTFLADRGATQKRERAEQIERNRLSAIKWFDEEYAQKVGQEGVDGSDLFQQHEGWDRASLAKTIRNEWMTQAKSLRKHYQSDVAPERIALCVTRARLFHRHLMAA